MAATDMSDKAACSHSRHALYKTKGHNWKETYRKRCLSRLRESRAELYTKRRGLGGASQPSDADGEMESSKFIQMVMASELKALQDEDSVDCEMDFFDPMTGEMDLTLSLIEEIQEEMKAEEAKLIAEYEIFQVSLEREEAALCDAIELLNTSPICPVCTKCPLMENKGIIFCKCGVRINTEQDGIGLDFVGRQLEDARELHECDGHPEFSVQDNMFVSTEDGFSEQESVGITNLLMTCQKCDFMYIVI